MTVLGLEWGPVGAVVGAIATLLAALIALMVALGWFDRFRAPRLRITFEQSEPWCRDGHHPADGDVVWVRVGVENDGAQAARGCVGRLIAVRTEARPDGTLIRCSF